MSIEATIDRWIVEEQAVSGRKKPEARVAVAREIGVPPGTLENLSKRRLKDVSRLANLVNAALIRRLERSIVAAECELEIRRHAALRPDENRIRAAEAAIVSARKAIEGI